MDLFIAALPVSMSSVKCRLFNCSFRDAGAENIASGLSTNKTLEWLE